MLKLTVSPEKTGAITQAFKRIKELVVASTIDSSTPITLILQPGIYHEILSYNLSNPITIESVSGTKPEDCVLSAENCEAFHKDTENRSVFVIGSGATEVTLKGFTIENTHVKTNDDASLGNQAEALCFHNQTGKLICENMRFISRQDTIHVKGTSRFYNCYVTGDVDFIWGYCKSSVFENCKIHTREDNRGGVRPAYVLQSRALNSKPGFIFIDCDFTADERPSGSEIYIGRSQGTGKPDSVDRWDSIALINCTLSENYNSSLWTDEDGSRVVYPEKGSWEFGWRQYGTKIRKKDGSLIDYDSNNQEKHGYTMTKDEVNKLLSLVSD